MNDFEIKLDRLADGELSRAEYAALLTALDHEEEGWKKCALALLESQALRSEMRGLTKEPLLDVAPEEKGTGYQAEKASSHRNTWFSNSILGQAIAVAACLGAAFLLGRGSITAPVSPPNNHQVAVTEQPSRELATHPHQGHIRLVVNDADGQPREVQVPVVDGSYVDPHSVLSRSAAIPTDVLEAIARSGHKIEARREFMRRRVDDEHDVVLPVDRLRVVPVSNPMY